MKIKMQEVANEANVSMATVTRVINNHKYVSDDVRKKVLEAIKKTNYVPLRIHHKDLGSAKIIGIISPYVYSNNIFQMISNAITKYAKTLGYETIIMYSDGNIDSVVDYIKAMIKLNVTGIIFSSFIEGQIPCDILNFINSTNIPIVLIERPEQTLGINKILINYIEGTYNATNYLLKNGHKHIYFLGKKQEFLIEKERYQGFEKAMQASGTNFDKNLNAFFVDEYDMKLAYTAISTIFESTMRPTAMLIASDILVAGVLQYFYEHNVRVPDDVSIVGADDSISLMLSPPITTIRIPLDSIAYNAVNVIIATLSNNNLTNISTYITPEFIIRNSVKKL